MILKILTLANIAQLGQSARLLFQMSWVQIPLIAFILDIYFNASPQKHLYMQKERGN